MHRIPYVIDNDRHKLADVLNQVLENHADLAMDVATAFFNVRGYHTRWTWPSSKATPSSGRGGFCRRMTA